MSPKSTAAIPSPSGWYSKSRRDFLKRLANLRRLSQNSRRASRTQEKHCRRAKAAPEKRARSNPVFLLGKATLPKKQPAGQSPPRTDPPNFNPELVASRSGLHVAP